MKSISKFSKFEVLSTKKLKEVRGGACAPSFENHWCHQSYPKPGSGGYWWQTNR
jgi:bacteriocin-like protein